MSATECTRSDCDKPAAYTVIPMLAEPGLDVWNDLHTDPAPTCALHLPHTIAWMSEHYGHFHVSQVRS